MIRPSTKAAVDFHGEKDTSLHLPADVIFEILIRTDIELLPILRCVCEDWRSLISQSHFINHHHQKSKTVSGHIFRPERQYARPDKIHYIPHSGSPKSLPFPPLDFLPEPVKIEAATTDGLLCCVGLRNVRNHYVCKPTTKEWMEIPRPRTRCKILKMDMVTEINDNKTISRFKIVRIAKHKKGDDHVFYCDVFDSSTWKWTRLKHIKSLPCEIGLSMGVVVKGYLCWLARTYVDWEAQIMAFDMWKEELHIIEIPEETMTDSGKVVVSIDGDKLGLLSSFNGVTKSMWVMACMVDQIWEKKLVFDMERDFDADGTVIISRYIVDDILFLCPNLLTSCELLWFHLNFKDMSYKKETLDESVYLAYIILYFESDFFPCNLGKLQCRL